MGRSHRKSGHRAQPPGTDERWAPPEESRSLIVVGAGPLLSDLLDLLQDYPEYRPVGILDPTRRLWGQALKGLPVLGWLSRMPATASWAVIGNPAEPGGFDRSAVFHILSRRDTRFPILKAADSRVSPDVAVVNATTLLKGCSVNSGVSLGENCLVGPGVVVEPHATVPPHAVLLPGSDADAGPNGRKPSVQPRSLEATLAAETEPIRHVIRRINWANMEIVLVVGSDGELVGTVTDGDIRRGMLAGIDPDEPVSEIMNRRPVAVGLDASRNDMLDMMRLRSIRHLPVLDTRDRPVRLERMETLVDEMARHDAVIMAGGLGSRLRPLTEHTPKPLLHVKGQPILDHVLGGLRESGIRDVVISLNYRGRQIRQHVEDGSAQGVRATYVSEKERLGTAGALSLLRPRPRRPFVVMNSDLLTNLNFSHLLEFQKERAYDVVVCVRKHVTNLSYGVVDIHDDTVVGLREKPKLEHFVNAGIYVLRPSCIDMVPHRRYFDMPSLIAKVLDNGGLVGAFPMHEYWRDIGTPQDLAAVGGEVVCA